MQLLAQLEPTTVLFLSGLGLVCAVLLFRTHRQLNTRPKGQLSHPSSWSKPRLPKTPAAHHLDLPRDAQRWEVQMHETARELRGQLDSKISVLQHLIRDAAAETARLEAAIERAARLEVSAARPAPHLQAAAVHPPAMRPRAMAEPLPSPTSRRYAEIYALADSGLASAAIATRVGSPIGEVELILGLRGKG
ncbi:MAG TPA: hypothetical protein VFW87_26650 [Pirellulales bacterium]|nr:hypothetical protein [Pirellulales bacterium]